MDCSYFGNHNNDSDGRISMLKEGTQWHSFVRSMNIRYAVKEKLRLYCEKTQHGIDLNLILAHICYFCHVILSSITFKNLIENCTSLHLKDHHKLGHNPLLTFCLESCWMYSDNFPSIMDGAEWLSRMSLMKPFTNNDTRTDFLNSSIDALGSTFLLFMRCLDRNQVAHIRSPLFRRFL